jgi:hypothetical protein
MAAAKPEIDFFIVFLRKTSAVHLLLGYKIHFTDRVQVFGVGELNGAIEKALRLYFEAGNDKFKMAAAKTTCTCIAASIQDSKKFQLLSACVCGQGTQ